MSVDDHCLLDWLSRLPYFSAETKFAQDLKFLVVDYFVQIKPLCHAKWKHKARAAFWETVSSTKNPLFSAYDTNSRFINKCEQIWNCAGVAYWYWLGLCALVWQLNSTFTLRRQRTWHKISHRGYYLKIACTKWKRFAMEAICHFGTESTRGKILIHWRVSIVYAKECDLTYHSPAERSSSSTKEEISSCLKRGITPRKIVWPAVHLFLTACLSLQYRAKTMPRALKCNLNP